MPRLLSVSLVFALAACTSSGASQRVAPSGTNAQIASALSRMSPADRIRATRPRDLAPGTRIYRPEVVEIETPGNSYIVSKDSIVSSTSTGIAVRLNGEIVHFSRSSSNITVRAGAQEVRVPPGVVADPRLGTPVETIR